LFPGIDTIFHPASIATLNWNVVAPHKLCV
jgi:hypothetical protein